ncbi:MAG: hypothetical protein NTW30_06015 [Candidatus Aenigmarchaeota archaeon]|nr:hypothetical protein [Candidatus Aenigmarchaeota archaeon]
MPQDPFEVVRRIEHTLISSGRPISINKIAKKTGFHYNTVKRYVRLMDEIQELPKLEVIRGEGTTLVRLERDLSKLPEEEQMKIIKTHFPDMTQEDKILIELMERGITSEEKAIRMSKSEIIEKLIRLKRLKETIDGRVYLTELGYGIAWGAKKIYG